MELDLSNKRVLVCGAAKSGLSAAKLLRRHGSAVTVQDLRRSGLEKESDFLTSIGALTYFGANPDDIIKSFDFIVVSPGIPTNLPFFRMAAEAGVPIIGEIELGYMFCKSNIVAVTGTNGKTTTTALIYEIFKSFRDDTEVAGNIGIPFCDVAEAGAEYTILEVSSFQLETVKTFRPYISLCLNITPDHLNRHETVDNYAAMKERVFINQTHEDFAIFNADDPLCVAMSAKTHSNAVFFGSGGTVFLEDKMIMARIDGEIQPIVPIMSMNIFGTHNIENAMAAVCAAVCAGIPKKYIENALMAFKGVEHRIEHVATINGVDYYNDSKATNTDAAIKALISMTKPVLLIAGGMDKSADFSDWVKLFAQRVKFVAIIGEASEQIAETCRTFGFNAFERTHSLKTAVELCYGRAEPGDVVLLSPACASWDMFDNFEQRGKLYKTFVRELEDV